MSAIDPSLRDVMFLLVMYPRSSFALSPWEVTRIFYTYQKYQKQTRTSLSQEKDLPALFQTFSATFGIQPASLARYFSSFYAVDHSNGKSVMYEPVRVALLSPILNAILDYRSIKLLASNQDLLKWVFLCVLSRQHMDVHKLKHGVAPLLTPAVMQRFADDATMQWEVFSVTEETAKQWAKDTVGLDDAQVHRVFRDTLVFSQGSAQSNLTFSVFTIFALRCFAMSMGSPDGAGDASDIVGEKVVRAMLESLSQSLTSLQQQLRLQILGPLVDDTKPNKYFLGCSEQEALLQSCMTAFNEVLAAQESAQVWPFLPPLPPAVFWDAPRLVELMRFSGIVDRSGSVSTCWIAFGSFLRRSKQASDWGAHVVPPTPVKADASSFRVILTLISQMCCDSDDEDGVDNEAAAREDVISSMRSTILPIVAAFWRNGNDRAHINAGVSMESMLRYGGARIVRSLFDAGMWLENLYDVLCSPTAQEVPSSTASRLLACLGLIPLDTVVRQAVQSMHNRVRLFNIADAEDEHYLSFPEFEELTLRCSLFLWGTCQAGSHFRTDADDANELLEVYRHKCLFCRERDAEDDLNRSWGVDFLSPYLFTLQHLVNECAAGNDSYIDLPDFVGISQDALSQLVHQAANDQLPHQMSESREYPAAPPLESDQLSRAEATPLHDALYSRNGDSSGDPAIAASGADDGAEDGPDEGHDDASTDLRSIKRMNPSSPTRTLLAGTKEALWPVYGTYCSCGDSLNPGKLSGPNLFALLSKLGVLTDQTVLSDIGILLHQISAHTHSSSVSIASATSADTFESPSLSFEEFLVFLCAFAQLRFDGSVSAPILSGKRDGNVELSSAGSQNTEVWFQNWKTFMGSSNAFRRLMEESVLPMLHRHPLLAHPQDARPRDIYSPVFSLEVLLAVEGCEDKLRLAFENGSSDFHGFDVSSAEDILCSIGLIPNVVTASDVRRLVKDVSPEGRLSRCGSPALGLPGNISPPLAGDINASTETMNFPQWEWIVCVVAYKGVEMALSDCSGTTSPNKISLLIKKFVTQIAASVEAAISH